MAKDKAVVKVNWSKVGNLVINVHNLKQVSKEFMEEAIECGKMNGRKWRYAREGARMVDKQIRS